MYGISLHFGGFLRSAVIQRALADLPFECGTELHKRRMRLLGEIEHIEARGIRYSNQDFDVLSGALNFLDAVAPEVSATLRQAAGAKPLCRPTFTADEQAAMDRGYTTAERRAISGQVFGIYPQAISDSHAAKLNTLNGFCRK